MFLFGSSSLTVPWKSRTEDFYLPSRKRSLSNTGGYLVSPLIYGWGFRRSANVAPPHSFPEVHLTSFTGQGMACIVTGGSPSVVACVSPEVVAPAETVFDRSTEVSWLRPRLWVSSSVHVVVDCFPVPSSPYVRRASSPDRDTGVDSSEPTYLGPHPVESLSSEGGRSKLRP